MADHSALLILFAVLTGCVVVMTVALMSIMQDLHRAVRELHTLVPSAKCVLQEAGRSLRHTRNMLSRADAASRSVESVVHQAAGLWDETVEHFAHMGQRIGKVFGVQFGNGTRVGPRRSRRK